MSLRRLRQEIEEIEKFKDKIIEGVADFVDNNKIVKEKEHSNV